VKQRRSRLIHQIGNKAPEGSTQDSRRTDGDRHGPLARRGRRSVRWTPDHRALCPRGLTLLQEATVTLGGQRW